MIEKRERRDRRCEPRHAAGDRVSWRLSDAADPCQGWLSDQSSASFSFITGSDVRPALGEHIVVRLARRPEQRCRVERVARYGENLSLIACRVTPLDDLVDPGAFLADGARRHQAILRRAADRWSW
ncbi:MAG: hypothetical protein U1A27_04695 [Phycisphaerae bacterium]